MQIVIDKESLVRMLKVSLYAITGADYKDIGETVNELLNKVGYVELPEGHGDIVDIETLIDMFWDGNSMEITKYDLSVIEPIIEADRRSEG